jgi:ureidoglycolate lyase
VNAPVLWAEPLTAEAFAPYGDVVAIDAARKQYPINDGSALRHDDLARIDVHEAGGQGVVAIVRAQPVKLPVQLRALERHRLGSQLFMPLRPARFLVVVAPHESTRPFRDARCFVALPGQGVQYRRGTWHHPMLALGAVTNFLVVDRYEQAGAEDCDLRRWDDATYADAQF